MFSFTTRQILWRVALAYLSFRVTNMQRIKKIESVNLAVLWGAMALLLVLGYGLHSGVYDMTRAIPFYIMEFLTFAAMAILFWKPTGLTALSSLIGAVFVLGSQLAMYYRITDTTTAWVLAVIQIVLVGYTLYKQKGVVATTSMQNYSVLATVIMTLYGVWKVYALINWNWLSFNPESVMWDGAIAITGFAALYQAASGGKGKAAVWIAAIGILIAIIAVFTSASPPLTVLGL